VLIRLEVYVFLIGYFIISQKNPFLIILTQVLIVFVFSSKSVIFFFEISIPLIILIMIFNGQQPERLQARWYLIYYSFIRGYFILFTISQLRAIKGTLICSNQGYDYSFLRILFPIFISIMLLVKFPIFSLHF